jgi:recombinational DNA repair protein (RecF pathway)
MDNSCKMDVEMEAIVECSRCGRKLSPGQVYTYQDKEFCENCLMKIGLAKRQCDPWRLTKDTETDENHKK